MRKPKMFDFFHYCLLMVALSCVCNAEGTFENAETSKDYLSNTYSLFDLRHTIPGEPDVDYPIFSKVPKTKFECTGRHEGYYADLETRCQVFRICAHTARSIRGFAFLCPNGTLFSQRNFVCDWYRNVNCEESEQYYSKNNANRIGSNLDMMARVRQMMEYPMKTISKALEVKGKPATSLSISQSSHHTLKKQLELAESGLDVSEVDAEQQQSTSNQRGYSTHKQGATSTKSESVSQNVSYKEHTQIKDTVIEERTETKSSSADQGSKTNDNEEIYVNSLGELSSDPGVDFVHDMARIIAEASHHNNNADDKNSNIVGEIVVGLNNDVELPSKGVVAPEYIKTFNHLPSKDEFILASNINNLLENVSGDLRASTSGLQILAPQRNASSFRFLSRGFTSQSERAKRPPYEYGKPKQTAKTIRFSANELPIDDTFKADKGFAVLKESSNNSNVRTDKDNVESSDDAIKFTTTPIPIQPDEIKNELILELVDNTPAEIIEPSRGFSNAQEYKKTTEGPLIVTTASTLTSSGKFYLNTVSTEPRNLDQKFLSPPMSDFMEKIETTTADAPTLFEFTNFDGDISPVTEVSKLLTEKIQSYTNTTTARPLHKFNKEETEETAINDAIPTPARLFLPPDTPAPIEEQTDTHTQTYSTIVDERKLDAEHHAAKLLLAGVKLTTHNKNIDEEEVQAAIGSINTPDRTYGGSGPLFIHVNDEVINERITPTITTASTISAQPETSASVIASLSEGDSFQERIRNYRRFSTQQRSSPNAYGIQERAQEQEFIRTKTTTRRPVRLSTTTNPILTTRSYLKRVAASRLRLSRPTAVTNSTAHPATATGAADTAAESLNTTKQVSVRNIDKEVGSVGDTRTNSFNGDVPNRAHKASKNADEGSNGMRSRKNVRNSLKRAQASRASNSEHTTTASPQRAVTKVVTRNVAARRRNRLSNFQKSGNGTTQVTTATTSTTTTRKTTTTKPTTTTAKARTASITEAPPTTVYMSTSTEANSPQTSNIDHLLKSITSTSTTYPAFSSTNLPATTNAEPQTNTSAVGSNEQTDSMFTSTDSIATTTLDHYGSSSPSSFLFSSSPSQTFPSAPALSSSHFSSSSSIYTSSPSGSSTTTPDDSSTFVDFTKLTRAIVDDSVLQNFRTQQSSVYKPIPIARSRSLSLNNYAHDASNSAPHIYEYNKLPAQAPAQLIPPPRPQYLPQVYNQHSHTPTTPVPRVVIAPAEGQRIAPNSLGSIISALVTQPPPKATPSTSYVPLDDFLTKKFGQSAATKSLINSKKQQSVISNQSEQQIQQQQKLHQSLHQSQQQQPQHISQQFLYKQQQLEQLHQYQQQQHLQQLKEQQYFNQHFTKLAAKPQQQQQYSRNEIYNAPQQQQHLSSFTQIPSWQQHQHQHLFTQQQQFTHQQQNQQYSQHTQQKHAYLPPAQEKNQPQQISSAHFYYPQQQQSAQITPHDRQQQQRSFNTPTHFSIFKQQPQQQLPEFPPLVSSASLSTPNLAFDDISNSIVSPLERDIHLNVKLPALTSGLIPAPTAAPTLTAQRRADVVDATESEISDDQDDTTSGSYSGASSYDVPLSSIGRLPNDITHLLRRLRRVK